MVHGLRSRAGTRALPLDAMACAVYTAVFWDGTAEGGVDAGLVYSRSVGTERDRDEGYMEREHE